MSKKKPINKTQNGGQPVPNTGQKIALDLDNAPIFAAKFLESILFEMRVIRQELQKLNEKKNG